MTTITSLLPDPYKTTSDFSRAEQFRLFDDSGRDFPFEWLYYETTAGEPLEEAWVVPDKPLREHYYFSGVPNASESVSLISQGPLAIQFKFENVPVSR